MARLWGYFLSAKAVLLQSRTPTPALTSRQDERKLEITSQNDAHAPVLLWAAIVVTRCSTIRHGLVISSF